MVWNLKWPLAKVKGEAWPWLAPLMSNLGTRGTLSPTLRPLVMATSLLLAEPLRRLRTLSSRRFRKEETTVGGVLRLFR